MPSLVLFILCFQIQGIFTNFTIILLTPRFLCRFIFYVFLEKVFRRILGDAFTTEFESE